jgi:L-alanine-DL-glutamate epimerase-like enolase superfamily enzyme
MNRRAFLLAAASPAAGAPPAADRISRIAFAPIEGRFHKFVTMNSNDKAPKGHTYGNWLVRIRTASGAEGVGVMGYNNPDAAFEQALRGLVGANPFDLYTWTGERITARSPAHAKALRAYRHLDGPLFDLLGKLTNKPAWKLLGESVRDRIEVYDGTLYFSDVWFSGRGVRAVVEECEEAWKKGYKGVKLKLGRGWKWMEKEAGLLRDIEVCLTVRKAIGPELKLQVDANNGYQNDPERAWRLMEGKAPANLYWMEEIFPEDPDRYRDLRARMKRAGIRTLIADGESVDDESAFVPYLSQGGRLIDVLQMDIRRAGFVDNTSAARLGEAAGAVTVPHNWGSQVGGLMGLHIAKAVRAITAAEDDRSTCDVIQVDGYEFRDGYYTVPAEKPGLSIHVDEKVYADRCKPRETMIG